MRDAKTPNLSIAVLLALYRSGGAVPKDVINAIYDILEASPLHPVWISLTPRSQALERATTLAKSRELPLFGIPFAVKDNIDVASFDTTAGCPAFAFRPGRTAFVVERLLEAGAILIGKTNLDQFATGLVGTRSPYGANSSVFNSDYISGGSSAGSAVAVASGLVSFSLGTDTAGSGRVPAAFNNIVGLKPSRGLLSTSGVVPACRSLDCVSIFSLTCADAATVFEIARDFDVSDSYARPWPTTHAPIPERARAGILRRDQRQFFGDSDAELIYQQTIEFIAGLGHEVIEIDFTPFRQAADLLYSGPYLAERFAAVGPFIKAHTEEVDPTVGAIIAGSERFSAAEAYQAEYRLKALSRETGRAWELVDVLLLPTAPTTYKIEEVRSDPVKLNANLGYYTNFVNLLDLSAVAVPAGFGSNGMPFGVTAVGPAFREYMLLEFADRIQHSRLAFAGRHAADVPVAVFQPSREASGWVSLAVVGAHLSGQPLNHQLTSRGSKLIRTTLTARDYKLFALTNATPLKPGLVRTPGLKGPGIEVEVWRVPAAEFGSFVAAVPAPLSIGACELADGETAKGFLCEPYATAGMPDITHYASWRKYLDSIAQGG